MITSFTTSRENATSTDVALTIREPGKYICVIKEADTFERNTVKGNFQFVRLLIETEDKRTGTIELCVAGGESNWQARLFDALCVCVGVENPQFVQAKIKNHRRGIVDQNIVPGFRCQALEKKRIGVLLQRTWRNYVDKKDDNTVKETYDLTLYKSFNADSELTASEIIAGITTPRNLAAAIEPCMKDRDIRKNNVAAGSAPASHATINVADTAPTEVDDPF